MSWACLAMAGQQWPVISVWASWLDGCDLQSQQTLVSTLTLSQKSQQTLPGPGTERADWRPAIVKFISKTCHFLCSEQKDMKKKILLSGFSLIQSKTKQVSFSHFGRVKGFPCAGLWTLYNRGLNSTTSVLLQSCCGDLWLLYWWRIRTPRRYSDQI